MESKKKSPSPSVWYFGLDKIKKKAHKSFKVFLSINRRPRVMHAWRNRGQESRMHGEITMTSQVRARIFARAEGRYAKLLLMSCFAKLLETIFSCFAKFRWMPS
jgi:hypothetical protein